jgi:hypothetical protein
VGLTKMSINSNMEHGPMTRHGALVAGLLVAILLAGTIALAARGLAGLATGAQPVYPVAAVEAGMRRDPSAWIGRTVLIRGVVLGRFLDPGCSRPTCPGTGAYSLAPSLSAAGMTPALLPLVPGSAGAWLAALRHIPVLRRFLPRPRAVQLFKEATYRVHLQEGHQACGARACMDAILVDGTS